MCIHIARDRSLCSEFSDISLSRPLKLDFCVDTIQYENHWKQPKRDRALSTHSSLKKWGEAIENKRRRDVEKKRNN